MNVQQVKYHELRFVLSSSPSINDQGQYLRKYQSLNVKHLVRLNELEYSEEFFSRNGIQCHDMSFKDGSFPPEAVIESFLRLCKSQFFDSGHDNNSVIAVHCKAGIGRAPTMVAIALISFFKLDANNALDTITSQCTAALDRRLMNQNQQDALLDYAAAHRPCCQIV